MITVKDIFYFLDHKAPFDLQLDFDNAGFLVGHSAAEVTKILVSLDITEAVASEAASMGAQLIVSHHPVIFHPCKSVTDEDPLGRKLLALTEHGISAICAHTNLDAAQGGVNDLLAHAVGLTGCVMLQQDGVDRNGNPYGIGRVGTLPADTDTRTYAAHVKKALGANGVRYVDAGRPVRRVAVGGGACSGMMESVMEKGCDTFLTSDVKYDGFLDAKALGVNLIDAGHYPTENVVVPALVDWLREGFPGIQVEKTKTHREIFNYL